ncbi:MAG: ParB family chromosome partitioning protein [Myxococcota bacterium]|jgi:ParB family chromosome partitioning protein
MKTGRSALGKGLGALIPAPRYTQANADYFSCPVGQIEADPNQPRQTFTDAPLEELVASIKAKGILQPIVVRKADEPKRYIVIAGERRLRAARRAGLREIPVLVKDVASNEALELALIENIQREDLDAIEEATAYQRLMTSNGYTQDALAKRLGKQRSTIANAVRLLKLEPAFQQLLIDRKLSAGHARCLLAVDNPKIRSALAHRIQSEGLSVRAAETAVKSLSKASPDTPTTDHKAAKPTTAIQTYCDHIAAAMGDSLGSTVAISTKARGRRGKIVIDFSSLEDLHRLHSLLAPHMDLPAAPTPRIGLPH